MSKIKLMTIIGTRPEIIRLAAVIKKCDKYFFLHFGSPYLKLVLCHHIYYFHLGKINLSYPSEVIKNVSRDKSEIHF